MSAVGDFANFICSAARLKREYVFRQKTVKFLQVDPANFVIYAVDTDIVMTFTNPALKGPKNEKTGEGYGQIFDRDSPHDATAIASALGTFVFYHLSKDFPLIQLPTHHEETQIVYNGVARKANKEIDWTSSVAQQYEQEDVEFRRHLIDIKEDSILSFKNIISKEGASPDDQEVKVEDHINELVDLTLGSSGNYTREYIKYLKLLTDGCLIPLEKFRTLLTKETGIPELRDALEGPDSLEGWAQESVRVNYWVRQLSTQKSRRAGKQRIEIDARALTRLEYLNSKLHRLGARLILISGDVGLRKASRLGNPGLADNCIRDPCSFLIESFARLDDQSEIGSNESLDTWLNGILADYTDSEGMEVDHLDRLIAREPRILRRLKRKIAISDTGSKGNAFSAAIGKWEEIKKPIIAWHLAYSEDEGHFFRELIINATRRSNKRQIRRALDQLKIASKSRIDRIWDELLIAFTNAGMGLIYAISESDAEKPLRSRNPPIIRFDSFPNATKLISQVVTVRSLGQLDPPINVWLEKLRDDTISKELGATDFGYLNCLIFAILCAAEGKWFVSRGLALRAIKIAQMGVEKTKQGSHISGREAYYLFAICSRLTASKPEELNTVRINLDEARKALEIDHAHNSAPTIRGFRFRAEEIATNVTEMQFAQWGAGSDSEVVTRAPDLFAEIVGVIEEFSQKLVNKDVDEISLRSTIGSLCINALQTAHIGFASQQLEFMDELRRSSQLFENVRTRIEKHKTFLTESYLIFSDCLFNKKSIKRKEIDYHFSDINIEKYSILWYDNKRFDSLRDVCLDEFQLSSRNK